MLWWRGHVEKYYLHGLKRERMVANCAQLSYFFTERKQNCLIQPTLLRTTGLHSSVVCTGLLYSIFLRVHLFFDTTQIIHASMADDLDAVNAILSGDFTPTKAERRPAHDHDLESPAAPEHHRGNTRTWRKRSSFIQRIEMTDTYDAFDKFKRRRDSLRLSASSVAALAGFHPYSNLPKLLMDLVYQGPIGKLLLKHDAKLLNIEMISEEEALRQLVKKAGSEVKNAFQHAIDVSKGRVSVRSVQDANVLKENIMSKVNESANLSKSEVKQLEEATRYNVNTGFGKDHEDDALNLYEKQCGWEVQCRNEDLKCWNFRKDLDGNIVPSGPAQSYLIAMREIRADASSPRISEVITIDSGDDEDEREQKDSNITTHTEEIACDCTDDAVIKRGRSMSEAIEINSQEPIKVVSGKSTSSTVASNCTAQASKPKKKQKRDKPLFSILGVADGMRDELYHNPQSADAPSSNDGFGDDDNWDLRQVVIECKHRMKNAFNPPPIYDQIQTVVYCMMYDTTEGEIVQVVRDKGQGTTSTNGDTVGKGLDSKKVTKDSARKTQRTIITSSRVSLNDDIMQHRNNWHSTILPRLESFVTAVYNVRSSDDKRYRMIRAAALASSGGDESNYWQILLEECSWLKDCDISFSP